MTRRTTTRRRFARPAAVAAVAAVIVVLLTGAVASASDAEATSSGPDVHDGAEEQRVDEPSSSDAEAQLELLRMEQEGNLDFDELCARYECVETPPPFDPLTLGAQLGVGVVSISASALLARGVFEFGAATGVEIFGWIGAFGQIAFPVMSGIVSAPIAGYRRGGDTNISSLLTPLVSFPASTGWVLHRYSTPDDGLDVSLTKFGLITSSVVLVSGILAYHVEESIRWAFGDRPTRRLKAVQITPTLSNSAEPTGAMIGWRGRF